MKTRTWLEISDLKFPCTLLVRLNEDLAALVTILARRCCAPRALDFPTTRCHYAFTTTYDFSTTLFLRFLRCSCDLSTTLTQELRFCCTLGTFYKESAYSVSFHLVDDQLSKGGLHLSSTCVPAVLNLVSQLMIISTSRGGVQNRLNTGCRLLQNLATPLLENQA